MLTQEEIAKVRGNAGLSALPPISGAQTQSLSARLGIAPAPTVKAPASNLSFSNINPLSTKTNESTQAIPDKNTPDTSTIIKNTAKSMVSGTIESGKDIAAAIGGNSMMKTFDALPQADQEYLSTVLKLRNKALTEKNPAKIEHYQNLVKNYKTSDGQSITDVFPELNKSTEQVIGDFASMGVELLAGGSLVTKGAEAVTEKAGLTLAQRLIQGVKGGGTYGALFGLTGGMQENQDIPGLAKSTAISGATGAILGMGAEGAFGIRPAEKLAAKESQGLDKTIGMLLQGEEKDVKAAKTALSNINTEGIKTYKDLGVKLNDRVKMLSEKQDALLAGKTDVIPMEKLTVTQKVGGQEVSHNYVKDAIGQLTDFYKKTNDVVGLNEIQQLAQKAETEGLTIKEVNDLAKLHGIELNGYNANGELASGLTKQAAENTRAGLKGTVRQNFGDKASQAIDDEITRVIRTRDLVGEVADKVNTLKQKVTERGLGEKLGRTAFQVLDKITGGGLKGFVQSFIPRGEGLKIMNALDLEKALQKNLKRIQEILAPGLSKETMLQKLEAFLKSISETGLKDVNMKDIPGKEGGYVINPLSKYKNIHKEDLATMSDFTDYVAGSYIPRGMAAHALELDAARISEKYGLKNFKSTKGLANEFSRILEDVGYKRGA